MSQFQDRENADAARPQADSSGLNLDAIEAGVIIDDRYQIISKLGSGGMCTVFLANHLILQRHVAVKVLHQKSLCDADALKRFRREAVAVSALAHPNIVKVFGFGFAGSAPFLAMEFIEGQSLADLLRQVGRMSEQDALPLLQQILSGLIEAHGKGIIHRDLKPSNIMVPGDGKTIKIVDFGIAKIMPESGKELEKLTQRGNIFGTVAYMSPEQCRAEQLDARSDLYSVGCLMYEVLTGNQPFQGETILATMSKHLIEAPPADPGLAGRTGAVSLWAMEKEPARRPQSAGEMLNALNTDIDISLFRQATNRVAPWNRYSFLLAIIVMFIAASVLFILVKNKTIFNHENAALGSSGRLFKKDGISFRYPSEWIVYNPGPGTIAELHSSRFGKAAKMYVFGWDYHLNFSWQVNSHRSHETGWKLLSEKYIKLPQSDKCCQLVFSKDFEDTYYYHLEDTMRFADPHSIRKNDLSGTPKEVKRKKEKILFSRDNRLYLFVMETTESDFQNKEATLFRILETFSTN